MATGTMSRILLTCLLCPLIAYAMYALFQGPYLIWGILISLVGLVLLFLIWRPAFTKSEPENKK